MGLYDNNLNVVVNYTYDSWGNTVSVTGSMADTLGQDNPFRYRGYYFDSETGLYYLNSRYYDANTGRFINADEHDLVLASPESANNDKNLFAYCDNNPVIRVDTDGNIWEACLVGLAVGVVTQYAGDVIGNIKSGKSGIQIFKPTSSIQDYVASGVSGAIAAIPGLGFGRTVAVGALGNVVGDAIRGNISSFGDIGKSAVRGAVANALGYGIAKTAIKAKVNKINNMSRASKKSYLRDNFYKNSQKMVNQNLKTFRVNSYEQMEKRFWSYRSGVYSTVSSGVFGGWFNR